MPTAAAVVVAADSEVAAAAAALWAGHGEGRICMGRTCVNFNC